MVRGSEGVVIEERFWRRALKLWYSGMGRHEICTRTGMGHQALSKYVAEHEKRVDAAILNTRGRK